jgi:type I restriction enzyme R subunit
MSAEYSEDRLVQKTTADFMEQQLGWDSVYAYNTEVLGPTGTLGRKDDGEVVLVRHLRKKLEQLNPGHPDEAYQQALDQLTATSASKNLLHANREMYGLVRDGVRVGYKAADGTRRTPRLKVIDFDDPERNHFLVVREMWVKGMPYRRRPDVLGFVNGLPLLFIELKAHHKNVKVAYDDNLTDYLDTIPHLFHHNAVCMLSNGDEARVGTMVSPFDYFNQWKRIEEDEPGVVEWETMLRALCDKRRFLDVVENFILFDDSPSGGTIKAMAANHQFMGVNRAFESVQDREVRRGKLGVFWHTQGSGKSYSMVFLSRKVHRKLHGSFTFVILTDRVELDEQIAKTFAGCGAVQEAKAVHAGDGNHLRQLLQEDHRYIFSLIHKFNKDDDEPYTDRKDVIVIADEAHRTQYGKLAENMRRVLPNASYIAFTGTPLMKTKEDQLTKDIFGDYVSKYDFKRAVDDGATVPLYYDNRGEKLDIATPEINDRIAEELEKHELDQDQEERLRRDLSRDYHVLTADERLDRIARDVVAHYSKRWETGKAMLVAIDKITCVRMFDLISRYWADQVSKQAARVTVLGTEAEALKAQIAKQDEDTRVRVLAAHQAKVDASRAKLGWLQASEVCVVVSEEQNEVKKFKEWGLDIVPHRTRMKARDLAEEFKKADHPFRFAIVCAMWLTGFDVPSLATLYLDKPMKGHTLMQAIARANRKAKGKNNGHLVDYNGMLKSLRAALAKYGPGGSGGGGGGGEDPPAEGLEELLAAFVEAINQCEAHLKECGFELSKLVEAEGFGKLALLSKENESSAVNAVCKTDETRARFEVLAREVFKKRKALVGEPELTKPYMQRVYGIDAIYKKLQDNKEAADITAVMMGLRGVVSEAITHQPITRLPGADSGKVFDISHIDFDKLRKEFEGLANKNTTVQSIKDAVEKKLRRMIQQNPLRMNFYERYREIIDAYNRETDRLTIEKTFEQLVKFVGDLSEEEQRSVKEGLNEEHLAVFDLLVRTKGDLATKERNRVKHVAAELLEAIKAELARLDHWTEKRQTQAQVQQLIYNYLYDENTGLPVEAYSDDEVKALAEVVYLHVYQQYESATESVYAVAANGGGGGTVTVSSTDPSSASDGPGLSLVPEADDEPTVLPFRRLPENEVKPFVNAIPLLDLKIAAGGFSPDQVVEDNVGEYDWVVPNSRIKLARDLFVAQVVGESMNRRIPNGAYCVWRLDPGGSRNGKVVLAQHRDIQDPETDGRFTVKLYESEKEELDDGSWRHTRITLTPSSSDPSFEPIVLENLDEGELKVVAELVDVLR